MKIRVNFLGTLAKYAGVDSFDIELDDDACYGDLLQEIGARYGDKLPRKCWDPEKIEFIKPISAIGSNGDIEEHDTPLAGHQEVHFLLPVSGG